MINYKKQKIEGMSCVHCGQTAGNALKKVSGVKTDFDVVIIGAGSAGFATAIPY